MGLESTLVIGGGGGGSSVLVLVEGGRSDYPTIRNWQHASVCPLLCPIIGNDKGKMYFAVRFRG